MATVVLELKDVSDWEKCREIVCNVLGKFQGIQETKINTADSTLTLTVATKGEVTVTDIVALVKKLKKKLRKEVKILSLEKSEEEKKIPEAGASSSNPPPPPTMGPSQPPPYSLYHGCGPESSAYAYQQNPNHENPNKCSVM